MSTIVEDDILLCTHCRARARWAIVVAGSTGTEQGGACRYHVHGELERLVAEASTTNGLSPSIALMAIG